MLFSTFKEFQQAKTFGERRKNSNLDNFSTKSIQHEHILRLSMHRLVWAFTIISLCNLSTKNTTYVLTRLGTSSRSGEKTPLLSRTVLKLELFYTASEEAYILIWICAVCLGLFYRQLKVFEILDHLEPRTQWSVCLDQLGNTPS